MIHVTHNFMRHVLRTFRIGFVMIWMGSAQSRLLGNFRKRCLPSPTARTGARLSP